MQSNKIPRNCLGYTIDKIAFVLIVLFCFCYSYFSRVFAQLHISVPFINFPIFIGEILLAACIFLLILKLRIGGGLKITASKYKKVLMFLVFYGAFVLCKASYGYIHYGPLAFRHAALFYYPFFALFTFEFFNREFLSRKMIYFLSFFLVSIVVIRKFTPYYYFIYTYLLLALFVLWHMPKKQLKIVLTGFLIAFAPYQQCFANSRASVIGLISSVFLLCFFFVYRGYTVHRFSRLFISIITLIVVGVMVHTFADKKKMKAFSHIDKIHAALEEIDRFVKDKKIDGPLRPIKVRIYTEDRNLDSNVRQEGIRSDLLNSFSTVISEKKTKDELSMVSNKHAKKEFFVASNMKMTGAPVVIPGEKIKDVVPLVVNQSPVVSDTVENEGAPEIDLGSLNNVLWRIIVGRDMLRELYEINPFIGVAFGRPFRSRSVEALRWNKVEIEQVGWLEPHNSYVHILYRSGIFGVLFLGCILWVLVQNMGLLVKEKREGLLLIAILVYWLVIAQFMVLLELPFFAIPFWSLFGITVAYAYKDESKIMYNQ